MVTSEKVQSYHQKEKNLNILLLTTLAINLSLVQSAKCSSCINCTLNPSIQCKLLYREGAGQTCQCQLLGGDHSNPQCNHSAGSAGRGSSPW